MEIDDQCHKAQIERAFLDNDYHEDTWDALAEFYENVHGFYPEVHIDLLGWFLINYHYHDDNWVYTKNLINC